MNERIRLLAEQARDYAREYVSHCKHYGHFMEHNEYDLQFEQKFAELLIRECARVAFESDLTMAIGQWGADSAILKHFGVDK